MSLLKDSTLNSTPQIFHLKFKLKFKCKPISNLCENSKFSPTWIDDVDVKRISQKRSQSFTQVPCTRISRKASQDFFSSQTLIRSINGSQLFLKYTRDGLGGFKRIVSSSFVFAAKFFVCLEVFSLVYVNVCVAVTLCRFLSKLPLCCLSVPCLGIAKFLGLLGVDYLIQFSCVCFSSCFYLFCSVVYLLSL